MKAAGSFRRVQVSKMVNFQSLKNILLNACIRPQVSSF